MKYLDNLSEIVKILQDGGVILCPTDTIWGLSCDAFDSMAVAKIFDIKRRDPDKPLILLISELSVLKKYVTDLHPRIENLLAHHVQPLTIIHRASSLVPKHLIGDDGTIAIRLTSHPLLVNLMAELGNPLVSTSANLQGSSTPSYYNEIEEIIKSQVNYICTTGRQQPEEQETVSASLIVSYTREGELIFIRE